MEAVEEFHDKISKEMHVQSCQPLKVKISNQNAKKS